MKRPKLDGFTDIIDVWLDDDRGVHRKQRHTAKKVFEGLRDEHGFTGGYTIIKDYMRERERRGFQWPTAIATSGSAAMSTSW